MKYTDRQLDEIDRLVAEKVFGWTDMRDATDFGVQAGIPPTASGLHHAVPRYTRSGDDMLAVVEKMGAEYHIHMEGHWLGPWTVEFCQPSREWSATAPTLPIAVALAAIAAVGHTYKEQGNG